MHRAIGTIAVYSSPSRILLRARKLMPSAVRRFGIADVHVCRQAHDVGPGCRNMHLSVGGYEQRSEEARQTRRQCAKFLIRDANMPSSSLIRRECLKRVLALRDIPDCM